MDWIKATKETMPPVDTEILVAIKFNKLGRDVIVTAPLPAMWHDGQFVSIEGRSGLYPIQYEVTHWAKWSKPPED